MSVLKLRAKDRYGNWGLELMRPIQTTDSKARDTFLGVATPEELAKYMAGRAKMDPGRIWDGYFKPALEAMDKATRDKILSSIDDDYGNELGKSKAESETEAVGLQFGGENQDEEEEREVEGNGATTSKVWASRTGDSPMRKWRNQDFRRIDDVQKANDDFWKRK